jgi:hypothetical protein
MVSQRSKSSAWALTVIALLSTCSAQTVQIPPTVPQTASVPVSEAFVSLSFEFGSFPAYAGNKTAPNLLTRNLFNNLAALQGTNPYVRVGGVTQDMALLDGYVTTPFNTSQLKSSTRDPTVIEYGGTFFDSYQALATGGTKFIHGLNLAKSEGGFRRNLYGGAVVACTALQATNRFLAWELGYEPDLYTVGAQGKVRWNVGGVNVGGIGAVREAGSWSEKAFLNEWRNITTELKAQIATVCPQLVTTQRYKFVAPGFSGKNAVAGWDSFNAFTDMGTSQKIVGQLSSHSAMAEAGQLGLTAESTLLNHTHTLMASQPVINLARKSLSGKGIPVTVTQSTSIGQQGLAGLSDTFASALWTLDHHLFLASQGVARVHTHSGVDFPAAVWQPVKTAFDAVDIKPNYYGLVATAAMVGNVAAGSDSGQTRIVEIPMGGDVDGVYAAYEGTALKRIMMVNLRKWVGGLPGQEQEPDQKLKLRKREDPATTASPEDATSPAGNTATPMSSGTNSGEGAPHRPRGHGRPSVAPQPTPYQTITPKHRRATYPYPPFLNRRNYPPKNSTAGSTSRIVLAGGRRTTSYTLQLPTNCAGKTLSVARLSSTGSDAKTDVSWDGYSYPVSSMGKPVRVGGINAQETVQVGTGGIVKLTLNFAEAAMLRVSC